MGLNVLPELKYDPEPKFGVRFVPSRGRPNTRLVHTAARIKKSGPRRPPLLPLAKTGHRTEPGQPAAGEHPTPGSNQPVCTGVQNALAPR